VAKTLPRKQYHPNQIVPEAQTRFKLKIESAIRTSQGAENGYLFSILAIYQNKRKLIFFVSKAFPRLTNPSN
jgi:hypothetical protein